MTESAAERAWRLALATTGIVVALDQITKQAAAASIARGDSVNVFFALDITNIRNRRIVRSNEINRWWCICNRRTSK